MLLSSPHFSDVLNDLSTNGLPPQLQAAAQIPQPQHQPMVSLAPVPQSVAGPQFNMTMAQDNRTDVYGAGWNSGIDMNFNPSVLAVFEVPQPVFESETLSGKSYNFGTPTELCESSKVEVPVLERSPVTASTAVDISEVTEATEELDASDPCFALFLNDIPASNDEPAVHFTGIGLEKPCQYTLVVGQQSADGSDAIRDFERLCSSMDAAFDRVCRMTDHLLSL